MERQTKYSKLDPMFLERWSPRSFLCDPLTQEDIDTLFEAARWAPSSYNEQPWLFVYARRQEALDRFRDILVEGNRQWAKAAPFLFCIFSRKHFNKNGELNPCAEFDAGSAFMSIALQAHKLGFSCHAMQGFHKDRAYEVMGVNPEKYTAICMVAVGRQGPKETLSKELQEKEFPKDRNSQKDFVREERYE